MVRHALQSTYFRSKRVDEKKTFFKIKKNCVLPAFYKTQFFCVHVVGFPHELNSVFIIIIEFIKDIIYIYIKLFK